MAKDFYLQPDAPDLVLDAATVLSIVRRHTPAARSVAGVDENGGEARAYAIDADMILKVQRPQQLRARTSLAKERFFLTQLAGVDDMRVPRVIGGGEAQVDGAVRIDYTLMTRMPGVAIQFADLAGERRKQALFALGKMLRRLHTVPQQPLFERRLIPGDHTPADVRWRFGSAFDDLADSIASNPAWAFGPTPAQVARHAMRALPDVDVFAALHSNPGPEHVFIDPTTQQLNGIIDFGDAYFGHPVNDLRRFRCPNDRSAVFAGYIDAAPVSDNFAQTWRVACIFASMAAVAHNPECRTAALDELERLLSNDRMKLS